MKCKHVYVSRAIKERYNFPDGYKTLGDSDISQYYVKDEKIGTTCEDCGKNLD